MTERKQNMIFKKQAKKLTTMAHCLFYTGNRQWSQSRDEAGVRYKSPREIARRYYELGDKLFLLAKEFDYLETLS